MIFCVGSRPCLVCLARERHTSGLGKCGSPFFRFGSFVVLFVALSQGDQSFLTNFQVGCCLNSDMAADLFWSHCVSYGKGPCLCALTAKPEEKKDKNECCTQPIVLE